MYFTIFKASDQAWSRGFVAAAVEPTERARPDVGPLLFLKGRGSDAARAITSPSRTCITPRHQEQECKKKHKNVSSCT